MKQNISFQHRKYKSLSGNKVRMDRDDLPPDYNGTGKV